MKQLTAEPSLFLLSQRALRLKLQQGAHVLFHLPWVSQGAAQNYRFDTGLHLHGR